MMAHATDRTYRCMYRPAACRLCPYMLHMEVPFMLHVRCPYMLHVRRGQPSGWVMLALLCCALPCTQHHMVVCALFDSSASGADSACARALSSLAFGFLVTDAWLRVWHCSQLEFNCMLDRPMEVAGAELCLLCLRFFYGQQCRMPGASWRAWHTSRSRNCAACVRANACATAVTWLLLTWTLHFCG